MSRASAAVRFPDGLVLFGLYDGTSDVLWRNLHVSIDEAWDDYGKTKRPDCACGHDEEVEIHSDYGNGFSWPGRACRHCMVVLWKYLDPHWSYHEADLVDLTEEGVPDWVPWRRS